MKGARIAVETCMSVKPDETVLVVTDTEKLKIAEALAPVERTTQGTLVIDSMGETVKQSLTVTTRMGGLKFQGPEATRPERLLQSADKNAHNIWELGIGTNPNARPTCAVLEDEKVLGSVHIALGDDTSYAGGHTKSETHLDGILLQPAMKIDGRLIMKNGKLLLS